MGKYEKKIKERLGNKLFYYEEVDSTNRVAKEMKEWEHGMVVVAGVQTAGRGTYGRRFYSKSGIGLYISIIIHTDTWHFKKAQLATIYTAVAVSEAIAEVVQITPDIKWVNDLFLNRKKIGGILMEKDASSNKLIIGIGINLSGKKEDFPVEIQSTAASLELKPPIDDQAAAITLAIYEKMLQPGKLSDIYTVLKLYKEKLFIMDQSVDIVRGNDVFEGKVVDLDDEGRLVVLYDGEKLSLGVGEVRIKVLR